MDRMSTLPTIKCSSCGVDIDILQLADHVCVTASPSADAEPTSPTSPKLKRAATFGGPSFSNRSAGPAPSGRMPPPPRIDSIAANHPFRPLEPSPMSKHSDPRGRTPRSAVAPPKSPFKMNRSVTTPLPRPKAPPSPDVSVNMDCAFPPFPSKSATPRSAKPQTRDRLELPNQQGYAEPSPLFAPLSPRTNGGHNITKRMDTIAPGPFDGRAERRPSTASRPGTASTSRSPARGGSSQGHRRTQTQDSTRSNESIQKQHTSPASIASRSSSYSSRSRGLPSRPNGISGPPPPPLPPASEEPESIDAFLDRLQKETMQPPQAGSDSGPRANVVRQASGEKRQPPPRPRRPSERDLPLAADMNSSTYPPRSSNNSPLRNPSRSGSEVDVPQSSAPFRPVQPPLSIAPIFGHDNTLHPLHTPSDSGLSDDSYASSSLRSAASSRSSPPGSVVGHSRELSKISRSDYIAEETSTRTASPESYADSRPTRGPGSHTGPNMPPPIRALTPDFHNMPESPMDPAVQRGASFDRRPSRDRAPNIERSPSPRIPDSQLQQQPETRRPKPASKGECRGCSEPIIGKSVKDSSGRLTGRYHKQCFVCRTCGDSFPTAEFYVFENAPYCEHHYHRLNGSLCMSCDRGIEGQYLETDMRQKFHPRCLTCATCRIVLRDDYFEVGGRKYCDRHGQRAAAPQQSSLGPGGYRPRNVQKRRTRLMMMA
ncbi:uncharacterized protein K460DRAFT_50029 [Cucurbitaria berberidis CBS 394.84]|uniref:LIM zinc-binding domain-containing protein n=1 Tax=Cucurbitaria berberidis CBS 394.84 TaxID=1168544 RepID=A0A9P4L9C6_9PLEO|nr:uncharacterized protein K460DRAFT_50029 [Cucurbitaria berberidis CBS 394.84]KAF1846905.1 hypothetical protein K460DRAFT_50029 [Cucurbitaria berberidis CBS 394.84]